MTNAALIVIEPAARIPGRSAPSSDASIVQVRCGQLVTDSLVIARVLNRRHDNVLHSLDKLIASGVLNRLDYKVVERPDRKGEMRRAIELTERAALIGAPFIGGRRAMELHVKLVDAFLRMREMLSYDTRDWEATRRAAKVAAEQMNEMLKEGRGRQGKSTHAVHYMTEAKLVNAVVFGGFEAVDRDGAACADLYLLEQVQLHNATLLALDKPYTERKAILQELGRIFTGKGIAVADAPDGSPQLVSHQPTPGSV